MSTEAQITANRQNCLKSTGPQTTEGKAAVAKNAVKHGIFAQENLIIGENQAVFDYFREEILAELAPAGVMESILAERIVSLSWRLKRAERMQNQAIDVKIKRDSENSSNGNGDLALGRIAINDFANGRVLERLSMYERRIELSLFRTMAELKKMQLLRKAEDEAATQLKNEKQSQLPAGGRKSEARNPKSEKGRIEEQNEKQSQSVKSPSFSNELPDKFADDYNGLSPFEKKEYELLTSNASRQNKPNPTIPLRMGQSQFLTTEYRKTEYKKQ